MAKRMVTLAIVCRKTMEQNMYRFLGLSALFFVCVGSSAEAQNFLVVDQDAFPGKLISIQGSNTSIFWQRGAVNDRLVPKIQSLTSLSDGSIAFVSGLDRSIVHLGPGGEREFHQGGYLARQVRTDDHGDLYWSGLETPQDNNPLPDGFIYRHRASDGQVETLLTFSQSNVDHDWWGAFDVRGGQVYVATAKSPAKIYRVESSIPRLIATVPFPVSSFRFETDDSILAADGHGRIYRIADLQQPQNFEVVVDRTFPIVDFLRLP